MKNLTVESLLKHSFCISISNERYAFFQKIFKANNLDHIPPALNGLQLALNSQLNKQTNFDTILKKHLSIMFTHYMAVSSAKALNYPYVCIFEDDAFPCIGIKEKFQHACDMLPDDADIMILGNMMLFGIKKQVNEEFIIPEKTYGLQSYVVMQKNYDNFLRCIMKDTTTGLTAYGKNVYLVEKQLFIQYQKSNADRIHYSDKGFIHKSLSKHYIQKFFKSPEEI